MLNAPWRYRLYWTDTPQSVFVPSFMREDTLAIRHAPSAVPQMRISEGVGRSIHEAITDAGGANGWTLLYWSLLGPVELARAEA